MEYKLNDKMSINDTLKRVKAGDIIYLADGIYKEKIKINVNNITIVGQSKENTIITNHDYFHKIMPDYNECNTFRSYRRILLGLTISWNGSYWFNCKSN